MKRIESVNEWVPDISSFGFLEPSFFRRFRRIKDDEAIVNPHYLLLYSVFNSLKERIESGYKDAYGIFSGEDKGKWYLVGVIFSGMTPNTKSIEEIECIIYFFDKKSYSSEASMKRSKTKLDKMIGLEVQRKNEAAIKDELRYTAIGHDYIRDKPIEKRLRSASTINFRWRSGLDLAEENNLRTKIRAELNDLISAEEHKS